MSQFLIAADSCSDLPLDFVIEHDITIIPMLFHFKQEAFLNYPDQREITNRAFYDRLRDKQVAKTSQINPKDFIAAIEPFVKEGNDVLIVTLSSLLSGSYNSMVIGRQELLEKYPDRKIIIVDSLLASLGEGFLIYQAVLARKEGKSIEETGAFLESIKLKDCALFTVDELGTLQRGGRISLTKAIFGSFLNMKPILKIDDSGRLVPFAKARGRKNAISILLETFDNKLQDERAVFISHADNPDEAENVRNEILKRHPNIGTIVVGEIGPVIGAHTGPGTIAIFFLGNQR